MNKIPPIPGVPVEYLNRIEELNIECYDLRAKLDIAVEFIKAVQYWRCELRPEVMPCCFPEISYQKALKLMTQVGVPDES